jgi:hypothetical protein
VFWPLIGGFIFVVLLTLAIGRWVGMPPRRDDADRGSEH